MHRFLSEPWVEAVRAIRDEHAADLAAPAEAAVNFVVTGVPDDEPTVHAHAAVGPAGTTLDLGHVDAPTITVTLDYDTARAAVVEQDVQAIVRAFLLGRIAIAGDVTALLGVDGADPAALLSAFDLSGSTTLGDLDPVAPDVAARIRAVTA